MAGTALASIANSMQPRPFEPVPTALLFDLDDTLCDYAGARAARLRIAFGLGTGELSADPAILDRMIEDSIRMHPHGVEHFADLFHHYNVQDATAAQVAADWYTANRFHGLELFPEAVAVLRAVRDTPGAPGMARRPVGIVTNGPAEVQRAKVELLDIGRLADIVLISGEFGVAKPDPEIFREALRKMGVSAEEAIFVGDSAEFDIAGAHGAGLRTVWVNRAGVTWASSQPRPTREIRSLHDLPPLVGSTL